MTFAKRDDALRLDSLEGLRFVSSVAIVAGHYIPYIGSTPLIGRLHLAVDLFFVISGIVIAERYAGRIVSWRAWLHFMAKRVARLYPLHLATLGFYVAIGVLVWWGKLHPNDSARYNPAMIVPNLLMVQAWSLENVISFNYVSWSISAELFVYLAFPLILLAMRVRAGLGLTLILLGFAALAWVAQTYTGRPLTRLDWQGGVLRALPGFAFGVWLHSNRHLLDRLLPQSPALLQGLLLLLAALLLGRLNEYATLALIWLVVASAYRLDRAQVSNWLATPWLARQGELTYSLYMLHTVVATLLLAVLFPKLLGTTPTARVTGVLLALPVLYLLARASLRWFETPLRRIIGAAAERRLGKV